MFTVRPSVPEDVPVQRELWKLAFGDSEAYLDNFYQNYYRPERVVVLEEDGVVRSMTAWFDTTFVVPSQGEYRTAYLYAVATHPGCRGRGLAARLLAGADSCFRSLGISAVTTVPAEPSLHKFFGTNGFRECFVHSQLAQPDPSDSSGQCPCTIDPLPAAVYASLRETLLLGSLHISLSAEVITYQEGACRLSGGGLYAVETPAGVCALCAEGMEDGRLLVKELLGAPEARALALDWLAVLLPRWSGLYRVAEGSTPFGMLKWLDPALEKGWDWSAAGYLGLAFD